MKKLLIYAVTILGLATSCFSSNEKKEVKDEKITLTVATWHTADTALDRAGKEYTKLHPNVEIKVIPGDPRYTKLAVQLQSGQNIPDIFSIQTKDLQSMASKFSDRLLDMTELMKKDGLDKKFLESSIKMATYDGKIYAMPWDTSPVAMFYRKDMFEKAGITLDEVKTYEGYINAQKKLEKVYPDAHMTDSMDLFGVLFSQLNGNYVKDGKININSKEAKTALELLVNMKKNNALLDPSGWTERITNASNNKIATILYPVWYLDVFNEKLADQKGLWGLTYLPAFSEGSNVYSILSGSTIAVSKDSKHSDVAYDFVKFALATEMGEDIMISLGLFPTYTPYYEAKLNSSLI